jgi:hypothetical protein
MATSLDRRASVGHWLACSLRDMPQLAATEIACNWALSHDAQKRLALATALARRFPLVGDDVVLDHLAHDRIASIRRAARGATHPDAERVDDRHRLTSAVRAATSRAADS